MLKAAAVAVCVVIGAELAIIRDPCAMLEELAQCVRSVWQRFIKRELAIPHQRERARGNAPYAAFRIMPRCSALLRTGVQIGVVCRHNS